MKKELVTIILSTVIGSSLVVSSAFAASETTPSYPAEAVGYAVPMDIKLVKTVKKPTYVGDNPLAEIDFLNDVEDKSSDISKLFKLKKNYIFSDIVQAKEDLDKKAEEVVEAREEAARIAEEQAKRAAAARRSYSRGGNGNSFKRDGVWNDGRYRYTWYSSNVLHHYRTNEWTPDSNGIYRDSDGYAVVASNDHAQGTVVKDTPFGDAKVYDSGCASGTLDVYTNF